MKLFSRKFLKSTKEHMFFFSLMELYKIEGVAYLAKKFQIKTFLKKEAKKR